MGKIILHSCTIQLIDKKKLEVATEEELDADEKDPYILQLNWKSCQGDEGQKKIQVMVMYLGMYLKYREMTVSE